MTDNEPGVEKFTADMDEGSTPQKEGLKKNRSTMAVVDEYRMQTGEIDIKQIARALREEEETVSKWKFISGIMFVSFVACFLLCLAASALAFETMKDTELATHQITGGQVASRRRLADSTTAGTYNFPAIVDREGELVYCGIHPETIPEKPEPEAEDVDECTKNDFMMEEYWEGATFYTGDNEECQVHIAQINNVTETVTLTCSTNVTKEVKWSDLQRRRLEQVADADGAAPDDVRRRSEEFQNWNNVDSEFYKDMSWDKGLAKIKLACATEWKARDKYYSIKSAAGLLRTWSAAGERGYRRCVVEITSRRMKGKPMLLMRDAIRGMC